MSWLNLAPNNRTSGGKQIKAKSGAAVAIKATARKLAAIFYKMLKEGKEFNPLPIETYNQYFKERKLKYINKQALEFGYALVPCIVFLKRAKNQDKNNSKTEYCKLICQVY